METVICHLKEIGSADPPLLNHMIGRRPTDDQRLLIRAVTADVPQRAPPSAAHAAGTLPKRGNVCQGLTGEAMRALEKIVRTRVDLSRAPDL
jgi:hypothetical protein